MISSGRNVRTRRLAANAGNSEARLSIPVEISRNACRKSIWPREAESDTNWDTFLTPEPEAVTSALHDLVDLRQRVSSHQKVEVHGRALYPKHAHGESTNHGVRNVALVEIGSQIAKDAFEIHRLPSDHPAARCLREHNGWQISQQGAVCSCLATGEKRAPVTGGP